MDHQDASHSPDGLMNRTLFVVLKCVMGMLTCLLTVIVFLQVLFRYALEMPLGWSEEGAMFLFQWCSFLGAALAVNCGAHFQLEILLRGLPEKLRSLAGILGCVCVFITGYVMVRHGIAMMNMNWVQVYPCLGIPVAYGYLAIPFSGGIIILFQIAECRRHVRALIGR